MSDEQQQETGPIYSVPLIDSLPIGGGMKQAMPSRQDLVKVQEVNTRVVAGYEVAIAKIAQLEDELQDSRSMNADFDSYHCCPICFSQNVEQTHPAGADDFGAFKCHDCDHQGEIGEDFPSGTKVRHRIARLNERARKLEAGIDAAHTVAHAAPELNMSNYDHDQVCELNTAMCEVFVILDALRKEQP